MSELIEERKKIIESHHWGWGDVRKKTRWKTFTLQFLYWLVTIFFVGLLILANHLILNTFFGFTDRFLWKDAPFLIAMMISFMINIYRYHLEQFMFFHYHRLETDKIYLTEEKNVALRMLLKSARKPRSIITFVFGVVLLFAGIICYFGENETWWSYMLIPFVIFEMLYLYDLYTYYQDLKKAI